MIEIPSAIVVPCFTIAAVYFELHIPFDIFALYSIQEKKINAGDPSNVMQLQWKMLKVIMVTSYFLKL